MGPEFLVRWPTITFPSALDFVGRADEARQEPAQNRGDGSHDGDNYREFEVERDGPDVASANGQSQAAEDEKRLHEVKRYRRFTGCHQGFTVRLYSPS